MPTGTRSPYLESTYLAGILRSSLPSQLLWRVDGPVRESFPDTNRRVSPYRAPTWSWASINVPVIYEDKFKQSLNSYVTIDEIFCELAVAGDPTGNVVAGETLLECEPIPVQLTTAKENAIGNVKGSERGVQAWPGSMTVLRGRRGCIYPVVCDLEREVDLAEEDKDCWVNGLCHQQILAAEDKGYDGWPNGPSQQQPLGERGNLCSFGAEPWTLNEAQFICLKVIKYKPGWSGKDEELFCLVLERSKKGTWERVGICMPPWSDDEDGLFHKLFYVTERRKIRIV